MSERFDCCFNVAIIAKMLLYNAAIVPDVIIAAASDTRFLITFLQPCAYNGIRIIFCNLYLVPITKLLVVT